MLLAYIYLAEGGGVHVAKGGVHVAILKINQLINQSTNRSVLHIVFGGDI